MLNLKTTALPIRPLTAALWLALAGLATTPVSAQAPAPKPAPTLPAEAAFAFNYVHTNAPPKGCGCFSLLGGSASGAYYFAPQFALVGEFSGVTNSNADGKNHGLTLLTYLVGARTLFPLHHARTVPFAQVLLGVSHDSGAIAQVTPGGPTSYNVFAATVGGGLDLRLTPRMTFRAGQIEYFVTSYPNLVNNHQNNLRVSSGVALRF